MRMTPGRRRDALAQMTGYQKQMFILGLRLKAMQHEAGSLTVEQKRRLEGELLPAVRRIQENQQRATMRGLLGLQIQRAAALFAEIMGEDWHPRPDNPVQRECQRDLLTSL